jgi:hypothetical protein
VVLGLTTQVTGGIDDRTAAAEGDEMRVERSRNERNVARRACRGKTLGRRWWFWGEPGR